MKIEVDEQLVKEAVLNNFAVRLQRNMSGPVERQIAEWIAETADKEIRGIVRQAIDEMLPSIVREMVEAQLRNSVKRRLGVSKMSAGQLTKLLEAVGKVEGVRDE